MNRWKLKWSLAFPPAFTWCRSRSGITFIGSHPLYDRATALCGIFLVFIFFLIALHRIFLRGKEFTTISGRSYIVRTFSLGRWRWLSCAFWLSSLVIIILPLATLIMGTFMEFFGNFDMEHVWTVRHWTGVFTGRGVPALLRITLILGLRARIAGTLLYGLIGFSSCAPN